MVFTKLRVQSVGMNKPFKGPSSAMLLLLFGALFLSLPAHAQFSSSVQGTVTDSSGAAVPDAPVTLTNPETNAQFHATTNGAGGYRFSSLAPGTYKIKVEATGFQQKEVEVKLSTEQTAGVDIPLAVGGATSSVTVTTEASGLNKEETRVETTLSEDAISVMPLENRGTFNLVNAAPGVSGFTQGNDNFANEQTPNASANGHYSGGNLYVLDGISITSNITGGTGNISPNSESLQEIALQTNTFSLDFAGGSGVTIEMTTKAGSNRFHGSGDYSFLNQDLQAYSLFVHQYTPFKTQYVSGTFGGPIIKDRTFFFASVEKKAALDPAATNQFQVEDPAFVSWAAAKYPNTIGTGLFAKYPASNVTRTTVSLYGTPDYSVTCATPVGDCNVPMIDNATQTSSSYNNGLQYAVRGDQLFHNGNDRLYGYYYNINHDVEVIAPRVGFESANNQQAWLGSFNYTHTFNSNLLNQASFAVFKVNGTNGVAIPTVPQININDQQSITGFGGGWGPGTFVQHNYSWRDVVSYVRGRHAFKIGYQGTHGDDSADFTGINARPTFFFNGEHTLTDFVQDKVYGENNVSFDPLTGQFKPLQFGVQGSGSGVYFEDSWKVRPNLTVTYGLRWDNFGNPYPYGYDTYQQIANIFPAGSNSLQQGAALDAQFADGSIKETNNVYVHGQANNWSPRGAFSWAPYASGKTTIRAGIGLYRDQISLGQVIDGLRGNPPGWVYPSFGTQQSIPAIYGLGTSDVAPYGYTYPTIPATGLDSHGGLPGANAGVQGLDPSVKIPKTLNTSVGVQQEFTRGMVFGLNYVNSYGWDQLSGTDFNRSAGDLIRNDGTLKRLNPSFGSMVYISNLNTSNYNAMIATLTHRVGALNYQASYTWSHAIDQGTCNTRFDYNTGSDCPPNQHDFEAMRATSSFDVPSNFKFSGTYQFPSPNNHFMRPVIGGWQLSGIILAQSGTPFSAWNFGSYSADCTGIDVKCGDYNADGYNQDLPNKKTLKAGGFSKEQYLGGVFDTYRDFGAPDPGTEGNQTRNTFRNPSYFNVDASVIKNNPLPWFGGDKSNLQLRFDFFNALNKVNLWSVVNNISDSNFGKVVQTYQPRIIQLGAHFEF
jgi:hypothetical protein